MKSIIAVLLAALFFTGCMFSTNVEDDQTSRVLVSIAVRNISCEVAMSADDELIRTLTNLYDSVKAGELSEDALAQLSDLTADRPTLAADISDLILLIGVKIDGSSVIGIEGISPELWETIEKAWNQGQRMCE